MKELLLFFVFIIGLGIVWAYTGGPDRAISRDGWFISPLVNTDNPRASNVPYVPIPGRDDTPREETPDAPKEEERGGLFDFLTRFRAGVGASQEEASPYAGMVELSQGRARSTTSDEEYIILRTDRNLETPLTISGWRIESSATGQGVDLPQGVSLPFLGQVNVELPISVSKDMTVYLITGRSPVGVSFRTNLCTGYFAQFQDYTPRLKEECPRPEDELYESASVQFVPNEACVNFVDRIDRCTFTQTAIPVAVGNQCQSFILETLSYSGCIEEHRRESNFYKNEWYVYLSRDQELWRNSPERIVLLDENGKVVDALTY